VRNDETSPACKAIGVTEVEVEAGDVRKTPPLVERLWAWSSCPVMSKQIKIKLWEMFLIEFMDWGGFPLHATPAAVKWRDTRRILHLGIRQGAPSRNTSSARLSTRTRRWFDYAQKILPDFRLMETAAVAAQIGWLIYFIWFKTFI